MKITEFARKIVLIMIVVGLFYTGIISVWGVQGATDIDAGVSSRADFNDSSSQSISVQAGNVTQINISGQAITTHWAGFFGEITGNITLQDSNSKTFYDWTGLSTVSGEVFASTDSAVGWSGIDCASSSDISALETALGITATDPDRINTTYTSNAHPDFSVGGEDLSGCNSTNAYIDSGKDASTFYQVLLADDDGDVVYTTLINDTTTGFDGSTHDFQLLVGEADSVGATSLYFYIEI